LWRGLYQRQVEICEPPQEIRQLVGRRSKVPPHAHHRGAQSSWLNPVFADMFADVLSEKKAIFHGVLAGLQRRNLAQIADPTKG
jgi:hypothetical protein